MIEEKVERFAIGSKVVSIHYGDFTEIDTEEITNIDYSNIIGEVLTVSVLMNRIGILKAEAEELVNQVKLDHEVFVSNLQERKRKELTAYTEDSKKNTKTVKPTISEIENSVIIDSDYKKSKNLLFQVQKQSSIIDSLYWAVKNKASSLSILSAKIKPEDYEKEIIEGTINGVLIKTQNNVI